MDTTPHASESHDRRAGNAAAGKYLTFAIQGESYCVDVLRVREIIRVTNITAVPQMPPYVRGVINLRGKIIPVMDLRLRFGFGDVPNTDLTCIVVVQVKLNDGKQNDNADLKQVLSSLKSIRVRSYRFDSDFVYSQTDVDAVRAQLSGSGWSQLVHTRDRKEHKDVDVYLALDREIISGLAIVASEPREFTIVNIVGSITAEQAAKLQKSFATSGVNDFSQLAP